eukprot:gene3013-3287_t
MASSPTSLPPLVLVTGVSGFIASWVAYAALKVGYRVRGTVRSLANENKVRHLRDLCPGSNYKIDLVEADLTSDQGWDEAVRDCTYILHVASPFPLQEPKDADEVIKPAVEGTLRVLQAASRLATPVKRVVVTSSVASICYGHQKSEYSDEDWTVINNADIPVGAYIQSKTLAEKAAWNFVETLPEEKRFELATINPSFVMGPMLSTASCSSADLLGQLVLGKVPGLPDMYFSVVSVFDVARAHLLAMTIPEAAGKRFMCAATTISFRDLAARLTRQMKPLGYPCTTLHVPGFLVHMLAFFGDKSAKTSAPLIGLKHNLIPKNTRDILGLKLEEDLTVIDQMLYAAIHAGIIPDKTSDGRLKRDYTCPEFDVSMIPPAR